MISNKNKEALIKGIKSYLINGCADIESFEDPVSEVVDYLNALFSIDIGLAEDMCKKTLKTKHVDSSFLKHSVLMIYFYLRMNGRLHLIIF